MTKKKKTISTKRIREAVPYALVGSLALGVAICGSLDKMHAEHNLSLDSFVANDYNVSVDQLSELYVVAGLSDALKLASASDVAANYVVATTMHDSGQVSTGDRKSTSELQSRI